MTPDEFDLLRRLFLEARDLSTEQRKRFVEAHTKGRSRVRLELESLLEAAEHPHELFPGESAETAEGDSDS